MYVYIQREMHAYLNNLSNTSREVKSLLDKFEKNLSGAQDSTMYVCEVQASIQSYSLILSRLANPPHVQKSTYELVLTNHTILKDLFQHGFPHLQDWKAGGLYVNGRVYPLTLPISELPMPCRLEYYQSKGISLPDW